MGLMIINNNAPGYFLRVKLVQIANDNRSFNFFDWNIYGADFDDYLLIRLFYGISENFHVPQHIYLLC